MPGDHEVGMPPVHTRFQKGRSGNPGGKPGPKKARRRRFAGIVDACLSESPETVEQMRCPNAFAALAKEMALGGARGKVSVIRSTFALLDELDGVPGRRRLRALDERLEEAEWVEETAKRLRSEAEPGPPPVSQGARENQKLWLEFGGSGQDPT